MGNSNAAKSAQLGMPFGTARARLVKSIMFDMMKRLDEDKCFKCGVRIEDIDHMSVEHKLPWQGRDTSLFWDLNNIAFSHLSCNRPEPIPYTHGQKNYERGCRCEECRASHAKHNREWRYRTGRRNPKGS